MPYLNSSQTDLQPTEAGGQSFAGGQFSAARQSIIPDECYGLGENVDNDEYGNAVTRRGSALLGTGTAGPQTGPVQGITQFYTNFFSYRSTIVANNGTLYHYDNNTGIWYILPASGAAFPPITGHINVNFAAGAGRLYSVNGTSALWSMSQTRVGVSEAGTSGGGGTPGNLDPPSGARDAVWHTNRLVLLGSLANDPVGLYFSQFQTGQAGQWNRTLWSLQVGSSNDPATGILAWTNHDLLVMKEDSLYLVNCNPTYAVADFTVAPLHKNLGCTCPRTAVQVGTDILLLAGRLGVIRVDRGMATDSTTEIQDPISKPIQDIINRINWDAANDNACAYYWNNRYFLMVPLDDQTTDLTTVVFNTLTQKWMGPWGSNWNAHCFCRCDSVSPSRMRFGRYDGKVYEWLDYVTLNNETSVHYQDNGLAIPTTIIGKAYDFNEPDSYKDLSTLKLEFFNSAARVDIGIKQDGGDIRMILTGFETIGEKHTLPNPTGGTDASTILPFNLPIPGIKPKKLDLTSQRPCFEVAAVVKSAADKMVLRKVIFSAFVGSTGVELADSQQSGVSPAFQPGGGHGPTFPSG